jgi:peptidoglycan/LPS O-acetylase OafA/YrhL
MRWLGLRSYSLYALHFPVMLVVLYLAQRAHISGWTAVAFSVGIGAPVSLLITVISFRFVEGPSLKRVARVGRRPAVPPLGGFPMLADQPDG